MVKTLGWVGQAIFQSDRHIHHINDYSQAVILHLETNWRDAVFIGCLNANVEQVKDQANLETTQFKSAL